MKKFENSILGERSENESHVPQHSISSTNDNAIVRSTSSLVREVEERYKKRKIKERKRNNKNITNLLKEIANEVDKKENMKKKKSMTPEERRRILQEAAEEIAEKEGTFNPHENENVQLKF